MSDSGEFQRPVQCSDDVPQQPPSFQTGREVAVSSASQNLETDAERDQPRQDQSRQAYSNPSRGAMAGGRGDAAGRTPDVIRIEGGKSTIITTGLAGAMQPGTVFQLGVENHMTVYSGQKHGGGYESRPTKITNKFKITDSQAEPTIKHLDVLSAKLAGDWRRLGRHLGLGDAELERIRMDYHIEGQHEVNYRVLLRWKQNCAQATLQMLAKALVEVGRGDLADELCKG